MYENHYHYQYLTISDNFLFSRDWLTVDEATERLYCFPCLLFSKKRKGPWVETGFVNLSYLAGALEKHEGNEHRDAVLTMKLFLKRTSCQVKGTLVSMNADEIERYNSKVRLNREIVKRIINAVIFLAKEEMAFRGHNEKITSEDRGPFKELLSMIAKTDSILFDHLGSSSVFRGDSKTIQNDLIHIVAEMTREIIAEEVDSADFFGVIADETTDVSVQNQLTVILRYVAKGKLYERFLGFYNVTNVPGAEGQSNFLLEVMEPYNLNKLVAQTYDGASTMSGHISGVQSRIRAKHDKAIYVHCMAHEQEEYQGKKKPQSASSATRWAYKSRTVNGIVSDLDAYRHCMDQIAEGSGSWTPDCRCTAKGFLNQLEDFEFLFLLHLYKDIFTITDIMYKKLQKVGLDVGWSSSTVSLCLDSLKGLKSDRGFNDLYDNRVDVDPPHNKRFRRRNTRLEDYVTENVRAGDDPTLSHREKFKKLHDEVIDETYNCVKSRFKDINELKFCKLLNSEMYALFKAKFPDDAVTELGKSVYGSLFNTEILTGELRYLYSGGLPEHLDELASEIAEFELWQQLPELTRLINLALTIPLTVCSAERSFSALKRIKTRLRNSMGDQRLSDLALIALVAWPVFRSHQKNFWG
ncbi:hypothetical protein ACHWQZ_G007548 [Mnemiopsis leidyi]